MREMQKTHSQQDCSGRSFFRFHKEIQYYEDIVSYCPVIPAFQLFAPLLHKPMLIDFFKKYSITADDAIVVACSAGPDSMLLLVETCKMVQEANIVVAHFNHCLR